MQLQAGKRERPAAVTTAAVTRPSRRLFTEDCTTRQRLLVDSGADVSVWPANRRDREHPSHEITLTAANQTNIDTFGTKNIRIDLGLGNDAITHSFIVANVSHPILGADFLYDRDLLIDLRRARLVDNKTGKQVFLKTLSDPTLIKRTPWNLSAVHNAIPVLSKSPALNINATPFKPSNANEITGTRQPTNTNEKTGTPRPTDRYEKLLSRFPDIANPDFKTRKLKHNVVHRIITDGRPVHSRFRRLNPAKLEAAKKEFATMESLGLARRSNSEWSSALTVVPKPGGRIRACGDYRQLNAITVPDKYPIPHIEDFNQQIGNAKIFSVIDAVRAYNQIPVAKEDIAKTAVTTPFGLFEFPWMPFGLRNAGQTFQRFIDQVIQGLPFVYAYLDDILIFSATEREHENHLRQLFERLNEYGVIINPAKSQFGKTKVDFLSFEISANGITPSNEKTQVFASYTKPTDVKGLLRFLGAVNFYRRLLPKAAETQEPLYDLLAKHKKLNSNKYENTAVLAWDAITTEAFAKTRPLHLEKMSFPLSISPILPPALIRSHNPLTAGVCKKLPHSHALSLSRKDKQTGKRRRHTGRHT